MRKPATRKRARVGDVLELRTPAGLAYLHFSHKDRTLGSLIRVLPGLHANRPTNVEDLARPKERFTVFFPVAAAVDRGIVTIVGHVQVPAAAQRLPVMRMAGTLEPGSGRVLDWWVRDENGTRRVGDLTPELRKLSLAELWNDTLLIERIASGWSPEDET